MHPAPEIPIGSWSIDTSPSPKVHLRTDRIGLIRLEASAPVLGGVFTLGAGPAGAEPAVEEADDPESEHSAALRLELGLSELTTGNPLLQTAARVLVKRGNGERLVFDAKAIGPATLAGPWTFTGDARAGDVVVPMTVEAHPEGTAQLRLGGSATFQDVHIPLPGLSHLNEISFAVNAQISLSLPS